MGTIGTAFHQYVATLINGPTLNIPLCLLLQDAGDQVSDDSRPASVHESPVC